MHWNGRYDNTKLGWQLTMPQNKRRLQNEIRDVLLMNNINQRYLGNCPENAKRILDTLLQINFEEKWRYKIWLLLKAACIMTEKLLLVIFIVSCKCSLWQVREKTVSRPFLRSTENTNRFFWLSSKDTLLMISCFLYSLLFLSHWAHFAVLIRAKAT